jgi:PAS domain S-box-containing protein
LGNSFGLVIRSDFYERHWQGIHDAISHHHRTFGTRPIATRALRKDGRKLYVEFAFNMVLDESGQVVGFMASARDVTQRLLVQCATLEAEVALHGYQAGSAPDVVPSTAESLTPFVLD